MNNHGTFLFLYFLFLCYNVGAGIKTKGKKMTFFEKLGRVFMKNIVWTVILIVAFIFFLYFAKGDLIGGILTAVSALVVYVAVVVLYQEYKKMFPAKKPVAKKAAKRK